VRLYLDSSALVKLMQPEAETEALRYFLRQYPADERVSSDLARVELVRAVLRGGPEPVAAARWQLARLYLIPMSVSILDQAATLLSGSLLHSLDAIHLATALVVGSGLRAVLTYDVRMLEAARTLGLSVHTPR
jgi:predicted nucleic acid-binding protein